MKRMMQKALGATALAIALSGCTAPSMNISTIQLSGATTDLPPNYLEVAAKAVSHLPVAPGAALTFSEPRHMVGETMFSPKRWYVCVTGVQPPGPKPIVEKPIVTHVTEWVAPPESQGRYDVIVVIRNETRTSLIKAFDSELCTPSI